jgi:hypothetical protein
MINGTKIGQRLLRGMLILLTLFLSWSFSLPTEADAGDASSPLQQTSGKEPQLRLRVGTFDPLAETLKVPARLQRSVTPGETELYLVQFRGQFRSLGTRP